MKRQNSKHPLLLALPVLAALVLGSFATTDAFAEDVLGVAPDAVSSPVIDAFSDVSVASPDQQAEVKFDGTTAGWAIIGGQAYDAKIAPDGNAIHQGNGVWKVKSTADISAEDRDATLELKGKAVNGKLRLHGAGTLESGDTFRIILRGHYAPIPDEPGQFVLDFSMAKIQNMENGLRIPLVQSGIIDVEPVIPVANEIDELATQLNSEG